MTIESTIERANAEIASGRLWRAKEILSSSLSTYGYSREICLAYADVLISLGDKLDAGKFYLLSVDVPTEKQLPAVQLFLKRYQNDNWRQLVSRFPNSVKTIEVGSLPETLANHLLALGAPSESGTKLDADITLASNWSNYFLQLGCLAVILVVGMCTIVGAYTILNWILVRT